MIGSIYGLILMELILVSWFDIKLQKISNKWAISNIVLSIILHVALRDLYPLAWETFIFPLGFIVFGFLLFILNIMGGGDSKYLASLFLIIPTEYHFQFFEKLLLVTIVIGSVLLGYRIVKNFREIRAYLVSRHWAGIRSLMKSRFSYAPVILIAWILLGVQEWR